MIIAYIGKRWTFKTLSCPTCISTWKLFKILNIFNVTKIVLYDIQWSWRQNSVKRCWPSEIKYFLNYYFLPSQLLSKCYFFNIKKNMFTIIYDCTMKVIIQASLQVSAIVPITLPFTIVNLHDNPMKKVVLLSSFCKWRNWGIEKVIYN